MFRKFIPSSRNKICDSVQTNLMFSQPIAVLSPAHFQAREFAQQLQSNVQRRLSDVRVVEVHLSQYAYYPDPLPLIYDLILTELEVSHDKALSDHQFLKTLQNISDFRVLLVLRVIDALPELAGARLAGVIRQIGDRKLAMSIVTGHYKLNELLHHSELSVSPLNNAKLVELPPFNETDVAEMLVDVLPQRSDTEERIDLAKQILNSVGEHPELIKATLQALDAMNQERSLSLAELPGQIGQIVNRPEISDAPFAHRVIAHLVRNKQCAKFVFAALEHDVHRIEFAVRNQLRFSGAFVNTRNSESLTFAGQPFRKAAQLALNGITSSIPSNTIPKGIFAYQEERPLRSLKRFAQREMIGFIGESFDDRLHSILADLFEHLKYDYFEVFVYDPVTDELILEFCSNDVIDNVPPVPVTRKSLIGQIALRRQPLMCKNVANEPNKDHELWEKLGRPQGAMFGWPLTTKAGDLIGVLGIGCVDLERLEADKEILWEFCPKLAPLVAEARMRQEHKHLRERAMQYFSCRTRWKVAQQLCKTTGDVLKARWVGVYESDHSDWKLISDDAPPDFQRSCFSSGSCDELCHIDQSCCQIKRSKKRTLNHRYRIWRGTGWNFKLRFGSDS